jgi:hypothetical protein
LVGQLLISSSLIKRRSACIGCLSVSQVPPQLLARVRVDGAASTSSPFQASDACKVISTFLRHLLLKPGGFEGLGVALVRVAPDGEAIAVSDQPRDLGVESDSAYESSPKVTESEQLVQRWKRRKKTWVFLLPPRRGDSRRSRKGNG